ncbi:MAG TPA: sugar ABC transporter ATP-binding protein [Pseudoneobacillus sp.]|nr:sugar ABC transporter ATP-binding protein [Pseudoneobacillus sp.]
MSTNVLQMKGIHKSFSGIPALGNVDFQVRGGEIHALLGANGAGKSTLMKILSGAYEADSGEIFINSHPIIIDSPAAAKTHGIQIVYQEVDVALVPTLTVVENVLLDDQANSSRSLWIQWKKLYKEVQEVLDYLGFSLQLHKKVEELSLAEKQMVLIARAVKQKAKFIIFDEPTAPLSIEETKRLFAIMKRLKDLGVGCIFISHRLPEVFEICDYITVMRDGYKISEESTTKTTIDDVIVNMLGKSFDEEFPKVETTIGAPLLQISNLTNGKLNNIHLTVNEGEIVSVVGLVGAGKTELSKAIFGAEGIQTGEIVISGEKLKLRQPNIAIEHGVVLVPEERRKEGILVDESVATNLSLPLIKQISKLGWLHRTAEVSLAKEIVDKLSIKIPSLSSPTGVLSGGNQQKVAIGKWLSTNAKIYLFDEPTKGVDVGAKSEIYRLIGQLAQEGKGILYFTCEFSESLGIADRILVMCDGSIVKELSREEATQEKILLYASGGKE